MGTPKEYFFELPERGRPDPHRLAEKWYPGVRSTWEDATGSRRFDALFGVRALVIHATAGSSSDGAMSVMKGGKASWHWLVPDENEQAHGQNVWACAPECRAALHVRNSVSHPLLFDGHNRVNDWSLGVEIVNRQGQGDKFSDWQVEITASIARYAWAKYPNLQFVISHAMLDPYRRTDPGEHFDWERFKSLTLSPPQDVQIELESFSSLDVAQHMDNLITNPIESLCDEGHDEERIMVSSVANNIKVQNILNWDMALELAEASKLAYMGENTLREQAKTRWNAEADKVVFIDKKETQAFVVETDDFSLISFRGSAGLKDWIANMKIRKKRLPYGKLHRGFLRAFLDVQVDIFAALTRARVANRPIWLTGHSLGGALAAIAAAHSHHEIGWTPIVAIHTFGQPKLCNRESANFINSNFGDRYFRFVNDDDIVTKIPPGSRHVGQLIHFGKDGQVLPEEERIALESNGSVDEISEAEFLNMQEDLVQQIEEEKFLMNFIPGADDHNLDNYIELIKAFA